MLYGIELERGDYERVAGTRRSVIGAIEVSGAGNVILRVGRENDGEGTTWSQTEPIVLTPGEANRLASELSRKVGAGVSPR